MNRNDHDPLDEALRALAAEPLPPFRSVRAEVHARLREAPPVPLHFRLIERMESVFRQPAFAITFVAACMLFGLFLAEMRVSVSKQAQAQQWMEEYARLINPRRAVTAAAPSEVAR